jgi:hypothetical protein
MKHLWVFSIVVTAAALVVSLGCSVSVTDKDKPNQKVDIQTPFANLKVDTNEAAADNGIPVYPGAKPRPKSGGDSHRANVNIGGANFGLKVIAAEYLTDASPEKVKAFYADKLKKYGDVLECKGHSSNDHYNGKNGDEKLSCGDSHGDGWELKVGTRDDQHIVAIEPDGSGTKFGTVLVQMHGKEGAL